jgi:Lecithin retinol acyltransferase
VIASGIHVRVRHELPLIRLPYWHGICVDDSEVIEFGGGDIWDKADTQVRRVSLTRFAQGEPVEPVSHPMTWSANTYSPLLAPEQVVDRAERLLHNQPPTYSLGYRHCESIAFWCATGDFERLQVKAFLRWNAPLALPTIALPKRKPSIGNPVAIAVLRSR